MKRIDSRAPVSSVPSEADRAIALETSRVLSPLLKKTHGLRVYLDAQGRPRESALLPPLAARLLLELLTEMAKGNSVSLTPIHTELTTQEAANLLNVSRPHVVQLIKKNELPAYKVGTHRRIRLADLQAFQIRSLAQRNQALDALAAEAQVLNQGY
jgi:excisionase family DNA binding protein